MKRLRSLLISAAVALTLLPCYAVHAAGIQLQYDGADHLYTGNVYNLYVNGAEIRAAMEPIIFNNHALVPVREVFERVGATVAYTGETRCVEIQYRNTYMRLYINDNCAYINGRKTSIPDDVVPKLINKPGGLTKTMVPVRFISESAGMDVEFDGSSGSIYITEPDLPPMITEAPSEEPTPESAEEPVPEPEVTPVPANPGSTMIYKPQATPKPTEEPAAAPTAVPDPSATPKVNPISYYGASPTKWGIDVSEHQKKIDWAKVSKNVDFAIIRCGYGSDFKSQDDRYWSTNVSACKKYGVPFGVYLYSYADSEEKAVSEADHVLRLLKGVSPALPVFYDMEDASQLKVSDEERGKYAKIFCDKVSAAGYKVGIYANKYWWQNYLTDPVFNNPSWYRWIAQYNISCTYKEDYLMWQYTGDGVVNGITGSVDLNYFYGSEWN